MGIQTAKTPRSCQGNRRCRRCSNRQAVIRKYDLMLCRQCFRENAKAIGFEKH
ncbi:40S ribosomal protein S29 [Gregarina niphandrodes]|uniref:40S ribosomal protein S29 n=1 Tax=Gregarina niphandrodes TaxID=110365 RepID=A0A023B6P6_GRENI|nr:40S ribosomal protein S29 [Gregarina niphandrodes]EZG66660.1 40S ribosomal protein S29 [Gregarina niphandrodes]|eukprot:XP_011130554.1 40S ribosomal protein S29 [Gregarina niphandrodes]